LATLTEDAGVSTDLTIHAGQVVVVSGNEGLVVAPAWGSGGCEVQQFGSVSLHYSQINADAAITVHGGASLSMSSVSLGGNLAVLHSSTLILRNVFWQPRPDSDGVL
jgi:hypothetical protein